MAVSSVFGGAASWAAERAIDGEERTEWSSDGDGDRAFITMELARERRITSIGLWTRTMGASGQISSFRVVVDGGVVLGPFNQPDASRMHLYDVDVHTRTARFEIVSSSGGNTGLVEIGMFAAE